MEQKDEQSSTVYEPIAPSGSAAPALSWTRIPTADIFAPIPPKQWVCEGLGWAPGRPAVLAGYGYSGKTLAAQCAALQLAAGREVWAAWDPVQGRWINGFAAGEAPRRVLHLDYEIGRDDTLRRYQRLARGLDIGPERLAGRLEVVCLPRVNLNDKRRMKGGANDGMLLVEDFLSRECKGIDLVVIDAFRGTIPGADENESQVRDYLDILTRVSNATNAAFVVLHHAGKARPDDPRGLLRGSSAIFDACGSVLQIEGSAERGDTEPKMVRQTKNSAAGRAAGQPFALVIVDERDCDGVRVERRDAPDGKPPEKPPEKNGRKGILG